jgi:hypothetical protein
MGFDVLKEQDFFCSPSCPDCLWNLTNLSLHHLHFMVQASGLFYCGSFSGAFRIGWYDDLWWIREDLKGSGNSLIEILFWNLRGGTKKHHETSQVPGVPTEIPTKHFPQKGIERYFYASLFGMMMMMMMMILFHVNYGLYWTDRYKLNNFFNDFNVVLQYQTRPITVAALSKTWTVFAHSNARIVASNPT